MRIPRIQSSLITTRIIRHRNHSHDDAARRVASTGDARDTATATV